MLLKAAVLQHVIWRLRIGKVPLFFVFCTGHSHFVILDGSSGRSWLLQLERHFCLFLDQAEGPLELHRSGKDRKG